MQEQGLMRMRKGPWTPQEDQKLLSYITRHGHGSWRALPAKAGLHRCGKSCRLRWTNYLRPDIKRGQFSSQEDMAIIRLHALLGNRWSTIAMLLPNRTDNEIKNYWNSRLKKILTRMGVDPVTHKPKCKPAGSVQSSRQAAVLSHLVQWETARLEAESRLVHSRKPVPHKLLPFHNRASPQCLDVLKVWEATGSCSGYFVGSPAASLKFGEANDVSMKGKTENSVQMIHSDEVAGMDLKIDCSENNSVAAIGCFDHGSMDFWNELLDSVSSPALAPTHVEWSLF